MERQLLRVYKFRVCEGLLEIKFKVLHLFILKRLNVTYKFLFSNKIGFLFQMLTLLFKTKIIFLALIQNNKTVLEGTVHSKIIKGNN